MIITANVNNEEVNNVLTPEGFVVNSRECLLNIMFFIEIYSLLPAKKYELFITFPIFEKRTSFCIGYVIYLNIYGHCFIIQCYVSFKQKKLHNNFLILFHRSLIPKYLKYDCIFVS